MIERSRLDRRSFLLAGIAGVVLLNREAKAENAACALDVELTQGPYYLDRGLLRGSITEGKPGLPLHLELTVLNAKTCAPLSNAGVEIWHCDASGIYSGYQQASMQGPRDFGGPPPGPPPNGFPGRGPGGPPPGMHPTDDGTFLRGLQFSNERGLVEFDTVYPGWYVGRDTHIHLKVHTGGGLKDQFYQGGHVVHTGQLFFADELSDEVAHLKPYARRLDVQRVQLPDDMVFNDAHGAAVMLKFEQIKPKSLEAGLVGTAVLHVDPAAVNDREPHDREQRWR